MNAARPPDWREGAPGIRYARCRGCGHAFYLDMRPCPRCGAAEPELLAAAGTGVVAAVTRVERAPSAEWSALLPYTIVLVDATEGFRMMAHAAHGVAIGDTVSARFRPVGDRLLPFFDSFWSG